VPSLPWIRIVVLALAGTLAAALVLSVELHSTNDWQGGLVDAGPDAPGSSLMLADFPDRSEYHAEGNHDGAYFYKITRDVLHPDIAAQNLDRPHYRLQRILFPLLARMVHPTGTGDGLVWSMLAVNLAGLLLGGIATGALSATLRGPPWLAAVFPLLPGCLFSLRLSTPDALALAFVLGAVAASLRSRTVLAITLGVAAALTKETSLILLVGLLAHRRDKQGIALVAVPTVATAAWFAWLHLLPLPAGHDPDVVEFTVPFGGWADVVRFWQNIPNTPVETLRYGGMAVVLASIVLAGVALWRRGVRHPLGWMIVTQLVLLVFLTWPPLAPERNGTRTLLPLLVLALIALVTPGWATGGASDQLPSLATDVADRDAADQRYEASVATTSSRKRSMVRVAKSTGSTSSLRASGVRSMATITSSLSSAARGSKNVALAWRRPRAATS
jgi:hypothetical protein